MDQPRPTSTTPIAPPSPLAPVEPPTREAMSLLRDEELAIINLDIPHTVVQILHALPALREVEARGLVRFRHPPVGQLERLERYAWALLQTHGTCQALQVGQDVWELARELARTRRHLLLCVRALVAGGALAAGALIPFQRCKGYRSLARSVCGIVAVCGAHWQAIEHRTPLSRAELEAAYALAQRLLFGLQQREKPSAALALALRERRQAFTLLLREYAELRRAARFLYPRHEAEQRVPSLFRKHRRRQVRPTVPDTASA